MLDKGGDPPDSDEEEKRPRKYSKKREPTETEYVECRACSYRFPRSYQKLPQLYFPTVGVRASGKVTVHITAYDRIRKHTAPTVATVQIAPSLGERKYEAYADVFFHLKQCVGATDYNLPDPLVLHVRDADPKRPKTVLANLFNFAGEMINQSLERDRLKQQAVQMDGFVFFLDPTQLGDKSWDVSLDRQLAALDEFMADVREARKVPSGQAIPVPAAVVIPKFDLLLTDNPIGVQSVPFIRRMLSEMNPPPRQTTLETIRDRSDLVEQMLPLMFRGVDVRGLFEGYFGEQVMFFPVSAASLFEHELGVKDLSKRTIAPFGVCEPFLWLLHMHGYKMFAED